MNTALQIQTRQPKISFIQIFLLILLTVAVFILIHWFGTEPASPNVPTFSYEEAAELAEEIYSAGAITQAVRNLPIESSLLAKMISEIERILSKTTDYPRCELYYLHARVNGKYPILGYGNQIIGGVYLNKGEVWKVGQTCNGEDGRYPSDVYYKNTGQNIILTDANLEYIPISTGYYKEILILEKIMIYTYPIWSGHQELLKPPGCKIFR